MLNFEKKIVLLKKYLLNNTNNYADSYKPDIYLFFEDFNVLNKNLEFLNSLSSKDEIENWINKLTSRIVLKYDDDCEQLNDFIFDYINFG